MLTIKTSWQRWIGCAILLLLTSGCFQAIGGDGLQPTAIAQQIETLPPLPTLAPQVEVVTDEPLPFEEITEEPTEPLLAAAETEVVELAAEFTEEPVVSATEVAAPETESVEPFIEPEATAVVLVPTETEAFIAALPTETAAPFIPTSTPLPTNTLVQPENLTGGGDVMQLLTPIETTQPTPTATFTLPALATQQLATPLIDPVSLTLTAFAAPLVAQAPSPTATFTLPAPATQQLATPLIDPVSLTLTAFAAPLVAQAPSPTVEIVLPADNAQQPLDPIAITATFIVERATMTASAPLTMTAMQGGIIPTASETLDPNLILTVQAAQTQIGVEDQNSAGESAAPLLPGADCWHEIRRGDTLFRLATLYGLTVEDIAADNRILNIDLIIAGRSLLIRGCGTTGVTPPPTSTPRPTATAPGQGGGTDLNQTPAPVVTGRSHIVRTGDTLFQIALIYGTTVEALVSMNPGQIVDINRIYIGQRLSVP